MTDEKLLDMYVQEIRAIPMADLDVGMTMRFRKVDIKLVPLAGTKDFHEAYEVRVSLDCAQSLHVGMTVKVPYTERVIERECLLQHPKWAKTGREA